ncbi:hypothetical protein ACQB60_19680 [Actinomycetota bacterium Odt1-20B]
MPLVDVTYAATVPEPPSPLDRSGLTLVIEIKSKWTASREAGHQERVDMLHAGIRAATGIVDAARLRRS